MATLGHVAIGLAGWRAAARAAPAPGRILAMLGWCALSLAPDLDAIGYALGVPYAATFGHRGATHSLFAAAIVGLLVGVLSRRARIGILAALVVGSHGVLDAFTDGGLGCALWWPLSGERVFAPWRPLEVAPLNGGMLSVRGVRVVALELVMFLPLIAVALWPRRTRRTDDRS